MKKDLLSFLISFNLFTGIEPDVAPLLSVSEAVACQPIPLYRYSSPIHLPTYEVWNKELVHYVLWIKRVQIKKRAFHSYSIWCWALLAQGRTRLSSCCLESPSSCTQVLCCLFCTCRWQTQRPCSGPGFECRRRRSIPTSWSLKSPAQYWLTDILCLIITPR